MSSYTIELRNYIESFSQYEKGLSIKEKIEVGRPNLFDFDYPMFDENYQKIFETHFIRKFYMREIGFETEGQFKFQLETWLNINMPYFNNLFESELIEYDPLSNSMMDVTHNLKKDKEQNDTRDINQISNTSGNTTDTATGESTSNTKTNTSGNVTNDDFNRRLESDNPDSRLILTTKDGEGVIEYANKINENKANKKENSNVNSTGTTGNNTKSSGNSTTNSNSNANQDESLNSKINEIEDYVQHRHGKVGAQTYPEMIKKYRESFLRIENLIFNEMQELFMLVY